jgi:phosphoglucomutase
MAGTQRSSKESLMAGQTNPQAGRLVDPARLVDVPRLVTAYFTGEPDMGVAAQKVSFGTSGHRGSAFDTAFNEAHILAITQAICLHRAAHGVNGPLFIGIDTHALSTPALASALEVLAANGVDVMIDDQDGFTPTPVISHAILTYNKGRTSGFADGIVITPSHNPPADGGFKYNPPNGGPADTDVTSWMERTANELIAAKLAGVKRIPYARAIASPHVHRHDYMTAYIDDLSSVLDMEAIRGSRVKIGIDPLGGAAARYWQRIVDRHGIAATVVNDVIDPTFRFMTADWDGKIRMDCSSPYAMTRLVGMRSDFDVAFANDTDADRHGIVTRSSGLMNPNHYLAVSIDYLFRHRPGWSSAAGIGKTIVSSSLIDRVAARLGRRLVEVPVGFKWFVEGLVDGSLGFGGEESAGASFLRRDGTAWSTDKDGIILGLLAAEIAACTGEDPGVRYDKITGELGVSYYARIDAPASAEERRLLKSISPEKVGVAELAGEPVTATMTAAPGNGAAIGGLKVTAANGWFAVRPSGTEDVYKIYAESFRGEDHLRLIQEQAREVVTRAVSPGAAG